MRPKLMEEEKKFIGYCQSIFKPVIFRSKFNEARQLEKAGYFRRLYKKIKELENYKSL